MSETLNVNVIVAAKEEYTKQLITVLQPEMYDILRNIFTNSQKNNIRRKISFSNFQKELKEVPRWSNYTLEEYLQKINQKYPYLMDLITAIFVSHVKILACVRIKAEDKSIKIKVPNLNNFLHKIIINTSEQVYYFPDIIMDIDKDRLLSIIANSIIDAISNQVPIEYILNEYLHGAFDEEDLPPNKEIDDLGDNLFNDKNDVDDVDSEMGEDLKKDIAIGEIGKMLPEVLNTENGNENGNENKNENENENDDDDDLNFDKPDEIEDSSDDEIDEDEDEDEDKKVIKTAQPALF